MSRKASFTDYIEKLQDNICSSLEKLDGKASFEEDKWERPGGGGGRTRIIRNGNVFEKGGVNTSVVYGQLPPALQQQLNTSYERFFACGLSLVIHPHSPMVPTVHANYRYFEVYDEKGNTVDGWFGGGMDLTPYYFWEEDAVFFHSALKEVCDRHGEDLYPAYKKRCDEYFYNSHRKEARGIGGLFFDYLKEDDKRSYADWQNFVMDTGNQFIPVYEPIVRKRVTEPFNENHKIWQEIRRGRYVEFNLIHDKGTLFGLRSDGRTESILMSLPATVRWEYDHKPEAGSREWEMLQALEPREWASLTNPVSQ